MKPGQVYPVYVIPVNSTACFNFKKSVEANINLTLSLDTIYCVREVIITLAYRDYSPNSVDSLEENVNGKGGVSPVWLLFTKNVALSSRMHASYVKFVNISMSLRAIRLAFGCKIRLHYYYTCSLLRLLPAWQ